ncbi:hypothetical protein [Stutzerimonas nitrititolerans]|uniref:hypothetical protein n=1 Tax=Stutzerimonas nitrititolerans TaxID=2482751 RepID=UPI0035E453AD
MMTSTRSRQLKILIFALTSAPGPALLMTYRETISSYPNLSLSLFDHRSTIATILASYAFTMIGFLAAVVAILLGFSQSVAFRRYKSKKYLGSFFFVYAYCLLTLAMTFLFSLLCLSSNSAEIFMRIALVLAVNSLMQVSIVGLVIANICKRAIGWNGTAS